MKSINVFSIVAMLFVAIAFLFPGQLTVENMSLAGTTLFFTPDMLRSKLDNFKNMIQSIPEYKGYDLTNFDIRPFTVRTLTDVVNSQNFYTFDLFKGYQLNTNTFLNNLEILLPDKKVFFPCFIRIGFRKINATGTLTGPVTYEDVGFFTAANEQASVRALFNGVFTMQTDNVTRITNMTCDIFRYVPTTQITGTLLPGYGASPEERGFWTLNPVPIIDTTKQNTITVELKGPTTAIAGAAGALNILSVDIMGFLWDPVSQRQTMSLPNNANCPSQV